MSHSYQSEIPKSRVNIQLNLHTGGALKKVELPLKLMVVGDYSHGAEQRPVSDRKSLSINKHNFDSVMAEFAPRIHFTVANTLAADGSVDNIALSFSEMKDFEPEYVARQIPQLKAMLAMRNLLRDLKANLLDNQAFRKALENILLDTALSAELHTELSALMPKQV